MSRESPIKVYGIKLAYLYIGEILSFRCNNNDYDDRQRRLEILFLTYLLMK